MGPEALNSAGYRGCMLANGKVWFNADESDAPFLLYGFNHAMTWSGREKEPSKGD
jgi:hypothetical protein